MNVLGMSIFPNLDTHRKLTREGEVMGYTIECLRASYIEGNITKNIKNTCVFYFVDFLQTSALRNPLNNEFECIIRLINPIWNEKELRIINR